MEDKRILILGATGAMAVYLIPELLARGYRVVGVTLEDAESDHERLTYIKANAMDLDFLKAQIATGFDAVVDFMVYFSVEEFKPYFDLFLTGTKHYVFFSTYRIYADDAPLHEGAKRFLDVERPEGFVTDREYSIYKAEEEDMLNTSAYDNYTIVRPAVTYSKRRFQLTVLEANVLIWRMLNGKTVILPEGAMDKEATMSWAGDVAQMLAGIILNPAAFRETYNVATSEHMKWSQIAKIYEELGGLKYVTVDNDTFMELFAPGNIYFKQQLLYDRCLDRIVDNSKILSLCGMKQEELMPLHEGLARELANVTLSDVGCNEAVNERMDQYLEAHGL